VLRGPGNAIVGLRPFGLFVGVISAQGQILRRTCQAGLERVGGTGGGAWWDGKEAQVVYYHDLRARPESQRYEELISTPLSLDDHLNELTRRVAADQVQRRTIALLAVAFALMVLIGVLAWLHAR
jgi:hypothetical protein